MVIDVNIDNRPIIANQNYLCEGKSISELKDGRKNFYFDFILLNCLDDKGEWKRAGGNMRAYLPFQASIERDRAYQIDFRPMKSSGYRSKLLRNKIGISGWVESASSIRDAEHVRPSRVENIVGNIRKKIDESLSSAMEGDDLALSRALILGDRRGITQPMANDFSNAGISHLIAISGLHVGLIILIVHIFIMIMTYFYPRLYLFVPRQIIEAIISIPFMWIYLLIAGFPISGVRAGIMLGAYLLGVVIKKRRNSFNSVALALMLILLIDPLSIFSVSLQLSVLAVVGILAAIWFLDNRFEQKPIVRYIALTFFMSAAAALITAPLVGYYFGRFTMIGFIVNLVAIPITGFFLLPMLVTGAVVSLMFKPIGMFIFYLSSFPARVVNLMASASSEWFEFLVFPFQPLWWEVVIIYAVMAVVITFFPTRSRAR